MNKSTYYSVFVNGFLGVILMFVACMAQWLGCRSVGGGLSLICA